MKVSGMFGLLYLANMVISGMYHKLKEFTLVYHNNIKRLTFKVEPYSIPWSFSKLEYLKTELTEDNVTYAIV